MDRNMTPSNAWAPKMVANEPTEPAMSQITTGATMTVTASATPSAFARRRHLPGINDFEASVRERSVADGRFGRPWTRIPNATSGHTQKFGTPSGP